MPILVGIYDIINGLFQLFYAMVMSTALAMSGLVARGDITKTEGYENLIFGITAFALPALLAIVGGIYNIERRRWGLALTGSIAATIPFMPWFVAVLKFFPPDRLAFMLPGMAAIVLTVLSMKEFE